MAVDPQREHRPLDKSADDIVVEELLGSLQDDVAVVPTDVVAQAVQIGSEFFSDPPERTIQESGEPDRQSPQSSANPVRVRIEPANESTYGAGRMILAARAVIGLSAAVIVAISAFLNSPEPAKGQLTLGQVLKQTLAADSLTLQISAGPSKTTVLVSKSGRIRREESATQYQIGDGSKLWRIDETANTAQLDENPWFDAETESIDLLSLLQLEELNVETAERFRASTVAGQGKWAGRVCDVFRTELGDFRIEAFIDPGSKQLNSIACRLRDPKGRPSPPVIQVLARDIPIDESKFKVATSLSEDGRIGKIVDSQGLVTLRPMMRKRWTPVARQTLIKPGDWLRTDLRGANASTIHLTSRFRIIAGPGTLLELKKPDQLQLNTGEVQIVGSDKADETLILNGPEGQEIEIKPGQAVHYRVVPEGRLFKVDKKPKWLAGYDGSSNRESIGSLVANIDGRSVPLTVGFHKVKVEIRDQIARTTIEESFVNHTIRRLEGVFHFPLPQDASISGFGMWINGELIEADVVEKQRAREIYETILRERRDPGLLEWTGGNIFKARVFPIEPHSEKRIKIVYTQVLPLRANQYRYSYGLRSEMLQKTPLQELSLEVLVNSALPLKKVDCPTHPVRTQQTKHSAKIEFAAQEYTPNRDFEVVCEIDAKQSDVVMIPHRRGDDGYFLVQLSPPGGEGNWQREIVPDGEPLELLIVCDTSASMSRQDRERQQEFVASVLASLDKDDRFNVAVSDVDCHWLDEEWLIPGDKNVARVHEWLSSRLSLGWTDLDRMTESVLQQAGRKSHVIYIGDGIVTARDADPQLFVNRLRRQISDAGDGDNEDDVRTAETLPTFHTVSTGSSFESVVLKALAGMGSGSVRQISGEQTPQRVALELLNEIAQPGLTDIQVEFRGIEAAAVYPERLPNLAAGTQQILIGRYRPQGEDQKGEIIVRGHRGDDEVRYSARIAFKDAEQGNSFIPRLWARSHLDVLLEQGSNDFIRNEIIALSEEFHIITPYTSLLVLETDEDRERFGVKRRYQMRDGEQFFADGTEAARLQLLRQQMKRAGDWRLGLRRRVLAELARLGRSTPRLQQVERELRRRSGSDFNGPVSASQPALYGGVGGGWGGGGGGSVSGSGAIDVLGRADHPGATIAWDSSGVLGGEMDKKLDLDSVMDAEFGKESSELFAADEAFAEFGEGNKSLRKSKPMFRQLQGLQSNLAAMPGLVDSFSSHALSDFRWLPSAEKPNAFMQPIGGKLSGSRSFTGGWSGVMNRGNLSNNQSTWWITTLLPAVPEPVPETPQPASTWPADAVELSRHLVQPIQLEDGGIEVRVTTMSFEPRWDRQTSTYVSTQLYSPGRWLTVPRYPSSSTAVQWCDGENRGAFIKAFQLGRVRKAKPRDLTSINVGERVHAETPMHISQRLYDVQIERPSGDRVVVVLTQPKSNPQNQTRLTIDTKRHVVRKVETRIGGKLTSTRVFSDHIEVGKAWWPTKIESFDGKGRLTARTTQAIRWLTDNQFDVRYRDELPPAETSQLVRMPWPSLRSSRIAAKAGKATFEQQFVLLLRALMIQNWDEAFEELEALEELAEGKPGLRWIRAAILSAARRNEDAHQLQIQQADRVVGGGQNDEYYLAGYLLDQLAQIGDQNEVLRMQDRLKPVFDRQPATVPGSRNWKTRRATSLRSLGRVDESLALRKELAESAPWDTSAQTQFAAELSSTGDHDAAFAWLRQGLDREVERVQYETDQLRSQYVQMLRNLGRDDELVEHLAEWIAEKPTQQYTYQQYLGALVFADRVDDAHEIVLKWFEEGRVEGRLAPDALARLQAAVNFALGNRYSMYISWIDPIWLSPLAKTAEYFLQHEHHFSISRQIVDHYRFSDSDESDHLRAEIARRLKAGAATLKPEFVDAYVNWMSSREELSKGDWMAIAKVIRQRWDAMEKSPERTSLGDSLVRAYQARSRDDRHLPFLRRRVERANEEEDPARAAGHVVALFNELVQCDWELLPCDWNDEHEAEAFGLLRRLSASDRLSERLAVQISALHRLLDAMLKSRFEADARQLQEQEHPEKLSRTELAKKLAGFRKKAREGLADQLTAIIDAKDDEELTEEQAAEKRELHEWMRAERAWLDLRLNRNLKRVQRESWAVLGDEPPGEPDDEAGDEEDRVEAYNRRMIQEALRSRAFVVVSYLALRRSANPKLAERLLKYVDAGIAAGGDRAAGWKQRKFSLLVALDQPQELERNLRQWIREDEYPAGWQRALARLQAERGKIDEAITLFEVVEREAELLPGDYAALADWYLVSDRPERRKRAKIEIFKATEEWQLNNWISQKRNPWYGNNNQPLPTELDENVLFAFQALFEKSASPQNYVYQLRDFYTACRDFRLLQMVADSAVGRTPQQVYPFLKALHSNLLYEVRNEATADKMLERLREVRESVESAIDLRALDLLECMIERRSAQVLNQPGPHEAAAVAALQRAFEREWAEGEVRQMADFLNALGSFEPKKLAAERLRQLRELHGMTEAGTDDRLFVGWYLSHSLFWSHQDKDKGLALMEVTARDFERARPDGWPAHANVPLDGYVQLFEATSRFAQGEQVLTRLLNKPANNQQRDFLLQRRNRLYAEALRKDGQVSLGAERNLYVNLLSHLLKQTQTQSDSHRGQVVSQINRVFRTAKEKRFEGHQDDLRRFAFDLLPGILQRQANNYQNFIRETGNTVKEVLGKQAGLEFLIARFETYPKRFDYSWNRPWQQFGYQMAQLFKEARPIPKKLERRLLMLTLKELRRELRSGQQRERYLFHRHRGPYYWEDKVEDFVRVAEEVLEERSESGRAVTHIALYLYSGVDRPTRAIEIMLIAHKQKRLNRESQFSLCHWLHSARRWGEAVPILEPLIERYPGNMRYRMLLLTCYARLSRRQQMRELLTDTDEFFRQKGRWTTANIGQLAEGCREVSLYDEAVKYFLEVISLVERSHATRGVGNSQLSDYYIGLARSYSGLGDTKKAVKAASDAIVTWGPNAAQRSSTVSWLNTVLSRAKDLDDYVEYLDDETAKNGTDSPLIRKEIGLAYLGRDQHRKAIRQFELALQLQPYDRQTHDRLTLAYDAVGDKDAGLRQTLALLDFDRHNLDTYKSLIARVKTNKRRAEFVERVVTSIVEAAPNEAEHHQLLAEVREEQDRWPAAIEHWKHVARLRSLEPNGLLELAEAQIHEKRWKQAQATIDRLNRKEWPSRFSSVRSRIQQLQRKIPKPKQL